MNDPLLAFIGGAIAGSAITVLALAITLVVVALRRKK